MDKGMDEWMDSPPANSIWDKDGRPIRSANPAPEQLKRLRTLNASIGEIQALLLARDTNYCPFLSR